MPSKSNNSSKTNILSLCRSWCVGSENLTWKYHIDAITAKICKTTGLISKLPHSIPHHILLYIYQTLIHPHPNYGFAVLQQASKTSPKKNSNSPKENDSHDVFYGYTWECNNSSIYWRWYITSDIYVYKSVASLMHDINNNNSSPKLSNLSEKTSTIHSYNTRPRSSTSSNFHVKSSKLEIH